jgi:serine/threonine-protein kinase
VSERLISDLASAVLDGTSIDWAGAEASADEASRPLVEELRVLAALANVHRQLTLQDEAESSTVPGNRADMPTHWGQLRLLERIGRGAYGDVYRAWDTRLDREVALKLVDANPPDEGSSSSIIHEGRLLARVRHPNVVTIYGAEQIGAQIGLWMEFVRGRTLKQTVDDGGVLAGTEAVKIGLDVANALSAVHSAGVLHRDVKAQNVMLADDGRAVLMDFGTGRELADNCADVAGTPLYLAPEVLAGADPTIKSDIYSLGVLLYYVITGSYPVRGQSVGDLRLAHQRKERIRIQTAARSSTASPDLVRIIERAIDPRPEDRYASVDALAADLASLKGRPARARWATAFGAVAVFSLIAAMGWGAISRLGGLAGWNGAAARIVIPSEPIVAVLPFENLSDEAGSDEFVDGLTGEIIRDLGIIHGLQVRSPDSSFAFKGKPRDLRDVGQQLGVNLVVDGSVHRSGNKLSVNVQLIHVAGNVLLWSEPFDRELKDIFAIQDDISRGIVNKLRLTLGRGQRRYDTNVEAYELYLKGSALVGRRGNPNLEKAAETFKLVLAKDAGFAPAHAGLATAYSLLSQRATSTMFFVEAHAIIRPAAVKALELDPLLPEAHEAMGWVHARELDWLGAEKAFQRAIDLNPSRSQTYTSYSFSTLRPLGKRDEALRLLLVALTNDPLSLGVQRDVAEVLSEAGRDAEAITMLERIRTIDPKFPYADMLLARALVFAGRPRDALHVYERMDPGPRGRRPPRTVLALAGLGMRAEAEALAAEFDDGTPSVIALIYAALGDKDRTFAALERTAAVEPQRLPLLLAYREMSVLDGDPRLAALRQKFRLPPQ